MKMFNYRYLLLLLLLAVSLPVQAQDAEEEIQDTVYYYKTWAQVFNQDPVSIYVSPDYIPPSSYEINFYFEDEEMDYLVNQEFLAATLGYDIWFVNSTRLAKDFNGDASLLSGYVPLFFTDKVAFVASNQGYRSNFQTYYYYIDFMDGKVIRITPASLSKLLEDYHDLQMRYEGMKDYKKPEIIEDYFFKYIDRVSQDVMKPYILDLIAEPIE